MRNDSRRKSPSERFAHSFDYTAAISKVCRDICARVPELQHIDMNRVAVSFSQTRNINKYGVYASLTPLRFEGGKKTVSNRGKMWSIQKVPDGRGRDYLYILYVCVPRFMELRLSDKLETVVHELYHISPKFDGDLRRFAGRCYAHGSSVKKYDATVRVLLKKWLDQDPSLEIWGFLKLNFHELNAQYGSVCGLKIPPPKIVPVSE